MQFQNGGEYDFSDEKLQDTFEFLFRTLGLFSNHDAGVDKLLSEAIGKPVHLSRLAKVQTSTKNIGPTWRGLLSGTS